MPPSRVMRATRIRSAPPGPGTAPAMLGLVGAVAAAAIAYRGPRDRFWSRLTWSGLGLGGWAILTSAPARQVRIRPPDVATGVGSAAVLYATFQLGDRFARRWVPGGDRQIRQIYALRELRPGTEIAARLVTVVAPAEEILWRGLVQSALMRRYGRWRGAALAAMAYSGAQAATGSVTLMGAAALAGAHWCILYACGTPLGALIVSHAVWDVSIFLVRPTGRTT